MKFNGETNLREWKELERQRDKAIEKWLEGVTIRRCPSCGQAYSFGYFPVYEDPGACQRCRGAEGDIVF